MKIPYWLARTVLSSPVHRILPYLYLGITMVRDIADGPVIDGHLTRYPVPRSERAYVHRLRGV
jgi:hypothetical protein